MDTEFAYWVPNVSGGLVTTDWPTKTDWSWDCNKDPGLQLEAFENPCRH